MQIVPIRDLRNTNEISERCRQSAEPIFVTKNGTAQTVNVDSNTSWTWSEVVSGFVLQAMRAARLKK